MTEIHCYSILPSKPTPPTPEPTTSPNCRFHQNPIRSPDILTNPCRYQVLLPINWLLQLVQVSRQTPLPLTPCDTNGFRLMIPTLPSLFNRHHQLCRGPSGLLPRYISSAHCSSVYISSLYSSKDCLLLSSSRVFFLY